MAKFTKISTTVSANSWGPVFTGRNARPLDQEEKNLRKHVQHGHTDVFLLFHFNVGRLRSYIFLVVCR